MSTIEERITSLEERVDRLESGGKGGSLQSPPDRSWGLDEYIGVFDDLGVRARLSSALRWDVGNNPLRPTTYLNSNRVVGLYFTIVAPGVDFNEELFQPVPSESVKRDDKAHLNLIARKGWEGEAIRWLVNTLR